jgi:hypothetical protein
MLGIGTLVSILKNLQQPVEDEGPEKSRSEYEPQANEGCEEKKSARCKFSFTILLCV